MNIRRTERAFALPTVVITAVILMTLLVGGLSAVTSVRRALNEQHYQRLAREAAESGVQYAKSCIDKQLASGTITGWGYDASTLEIGELCNGSYPSGVNCTSTPTSTPNQCYVYYDTATPGVRSRFSVAALAILSSNAYTISATGTVSLYNSSGAAYKTYTESQFVRSGTDTSYGVVSGNDTVCSILSGKLYCWGWNNFGQVGNGTKTPGVYVTSPRLVAGALSGLYVQAVATGTTYTCAIAGPTSAPAAGNAVYCWGENTGYHYGNNSTAESYVPLKVVTMTNYYFTSITASFHTCVVAKSTVSPYNSNLFCWGVNDQLQAGENSATNAAAVTTDPKKVPGVAVRTGNSTSTNLNAVTSVEGVSSDMTCGTNGLVPFCLGNNGSGQGGFGTNSGDYARPTLLSAYLSNTTEIHTNRARICALNGGKLYCWGNNSDWRIDSGPAFSGLAEQTTPKRIHTTANATLYNATISDFAISDWNTCVLVSGKVYCSGYNNYGQLGIGTFSGPTDGTATAASQVVSANNAIAIGGDLTGKVVTRLTAGNNHFCAVTSTREVYCWGLNAYGQLGDGTLVNRALPTRTVLPREIIY